MKTKQNAMVERCKPISPAGVKSNVCKETQVDKIMLLQHACRRDRQEIPTDLLQFILPQPSLVSKWSAFQTLPYAVHMLARCRNRFLKASINLAHTAEKCTLTALRAPFFSISFPLSAPESHPVFAPHLVLMS